MTRPVSAKVALAWLLSLMVVAIGSQLFAQTNNSAGRVVTGSDLGFRVDGERNGVPTGHFVIRVSGNWVEVKEAVGVSRLTR